MYLVVVLVALLKPVEKHDPAGGTTSARGETRPRTNQRTTALRSCHNWAASTALWSETGRPAHSTRQGTTFGGEPGKQSVEAALSFSFLSKLRPRVTSPSQALCDWWICTKGGARRQVCLFSSQICRCQFSQALQRSLQMLQEMLPQGAEDWIGISGF